MDEINRIMENPWFIKSVKAIITIAVGLIIYYIFKGIMDRYIKKSKLLSNRKISNTYINVLKNITKYIIMVIILLIILQILEIDITSIVAGVGLFGAAFVLAIQDFFKDITRGTSIISEDYFKVGDVVKYKSIEGKVVYLGLKNTKIQVLKNGNIMSIANRNIEEIEVLSNEIYIEIPLPYELKVKKKKKIMDTIISKIKKLDNVEDSKYLGTNELADSSIKYLIKINCNPLNKLQVRRNAIKEALLVLEDNNISVPYNQIDVHNK